ncbi:glycosyltransferase family 2 protein [Leifsonia sp. 21MFCrub1.1]|uniref:glycosyltransferase family 2 protein n=1 Tax=Leifsonia sp. 21MFCrub1.1 TaxID=1798223 RepID=UPI000892992E|nr:glycosyltransferase family 2 protein [Leifsonia sp. 21MFCrub1.1]SEB00376.1 Glycosyltransferase involved in cell wall bisynthesis [Leifsonia sp. 21MFCrub1.1]
MADRISVALCTHNGADFLPAQLASITAQTRHVDEIVVSDDASTDATRAILDEFRAAAPETLDVVLLVNEEPLGVTRNFETAIQATTGDLILLCDQDDVWSPGKVAELERLLAAEGALLAHSDARIVDGTGRPSGATLFETLGVGRAELEAEESGRGDEVLLRRNIVTGATCALRRELAAEAMPFPASWVHDEWLAIWAALDGGLRVSRQTLTDYRVHGRNQIGASKLTAESAVSRLRMPRSGRNARLAARAEDLLGRFAEARPGDPRIAVLRDKAEHERVRSSYPARRVRRVGPVLRELRTGRYSRFGGGARDVLRDLVQPV